MNEVYEYRRAPSKGAIWLASVGVVMLLAAVIFNEAYNLISLVWITGAVTFGWMLMPQPISGIRVDDENLVLSAWRNPRPIPLDSIAYLRSTDASLEISIAIVFKDGQEEGIFVGDLPDIDTLVTVMALRGIPVRDIY